MTLPRVQTKTEIEALLQSAGLAPQRRFGQHFLIDGNLMRRVVDASGLEQSDVALEVGAGTGGLTDLLAARAVRVVSVEIDHGLAALLERRFAERDNVTIVHADALAKKSEIAEEVADAITQAEQMCGGPVRLVANLPYNIATPLLMNLLTKFPAVRSFTFTVQAEVGDRLVATASEKSFGPLAIVCQTLATPSVVCRIPPSAFWPRPAVDSVLLHVDRRGGEGPEYSAPEEFATFVRGGFEKRRKKLKTGLAAIVDETRLARLSDTFDLSRRPEELSREEWVRLFRAARADV